MPISADNGEAWQWRFEACEANRTASERCHDETAQECKGRTCHKRAGPAQNQRPISAPQAKAYSQYLREERQEERGDDDGDSTVVNDACCEKDAARGSASDIARNICPV
jgi:hypothetical protein